MTPKPLPFSDGPSALFYVVNASKNPDRVECHVPWALGDEEIFFGPCKKLLRQRLKKELLRDAQERVPPHDILVFGVNGLSGRGVRKVVWVGRVKRLMTFARAAETLRGGRYAQLWEIENSPLHVEPDYRDGEVVAYTWRAGAQHPGVWVEDLTSRPRRTRLVGDRLERRPGESVAAAFDRDLCFLAENLHFAAGQGLAIDEELLRILRRAQPNKRDIDDRAVFGRTASGTVDGKRGHYLSISEPEQIVALRAWLDKRTPGRAPSATFRPTRSKRCG